MPIQVTKFFKTKKFVVSEWDFNKPKSVGEERKGHETNSAGGSFYKLQVGAGRQERILCKGGIENLWLPEQSRERISQRLNKLGLAK